LEADQRSTPVIRSRSAGKKQTRRVLYKTRTPRASPRQPPPPGPGALRRQLVEPIGQSRKGGDRLLSLRLFALEFGSVLGLARGALVGLGLHRLMQPWPEATYLGPNLLLMPVKRGCSRPARVPVEYRPSSDGRLTRRGGGLISFFSARPKTLPLTMVKAIVR
jgi:hypothetical protein